jgi:hypothetical protein
VRHPSTCLLSALWFPAEPARLMALGEHRIEGDLAVTAIACSPSGRLEAVAAGTFDTSRSLSIWDLARRERVRELPAHGEIRGIAWSGDEQTLVTGRGTAPPRGQGSQSPSLFVWNATDGTERLHFGGELFGYELFGDDLFGFRGVAISLARRAFPASVRHAGKDGAGRLDTGSMGPCFGEAGKASGEFGTSRRAGAASVWKRGVQPRRRAGDRLFRVLCIESAAK